MSTPEPHETESPEIDTQDIDPYLEGHLEGEGVSPVHEQPAEREVPTAPTTGDQVVDEAMIELAAAESGTLAERIDAGERAHRLLQGRLSDLGGA